MEIKPIKRLKPIGEPDEVAQLKPKRVWETKDKTLKPPEYIPQITAGKMGEPITTTQGIAQPIQQMPAQQTTITPVSQEPVIQPPVQPPTEIQQAQEPAITEPKVDEVAIPRKVNYVTPPQNVDVGMRELTSNISTMANYNAPMAMNAISGVYKAIDDAERKIMEILEQQGSGMDRYTQLALDELKKRADEEKNKIISVYNRKGLARGNLLAQEINRFQQNALSEQEKLLAENVRLQQDRLYNMVLQFGLQRANIAMWEEEFREKVRQAKVSEAQWELARQDAMRKWEGEMAWDKEKFEKEFAESLRRFGVTMDFEREKLATEKEQFREGLKWDKEKFGRQIEFDIRKLSSEERRFYDNLASEERRFYAGLSHAERMAVLRGETTIQDVVKEQTDFILDIIKDNITRDPNFNRDKVMEYLTVLKKFNMLDKVDEKYLYSELNKLFGIKEEPPTEPKKYDVELVKNSILGYSLEELVKEKNKYINIKNELQKQGNMTDIKDINAIINMLDTKIKEKRLAVTGKAKTETRRTRTYNVPQITKKGRQR